MEQPYIRARQVQDRFSLIVGIALTAGLHLAVGIFCAFSGLKYLYPPPPESTFLIDFDALEEEEVPVQGKRGRQPQAETVDKTKPIELVQKSESPYVNTRPNNTPATKPDTHGDVDVPVPEQEPALDPRAAFPGMSKQDNSTTAPHSASEASATFKAGQADGNTKTGKTEGTSNAHVEGRSVIGSLPKPAYNIQAEGTVVVRIKVDNYGNVKEAVPGYDGTTITDKTLWTAARNAALKAHFNQKADAPAFQMGTITYKFKLH